MDKNEGLDGHSAKFDFGQVLVSGKGLCLLRIIASCFHHLIQSVSDAFRFKQVCKRHFCNLFFGASEDIAEPVSDPRHHIRLVEQYKHLSMITIIIFRDVFQNG